MKYIKRIKIPKIPFKPSWLYWIAGGLIGINLVIFIVLLSRPNQTAPAPVMQPEIEEVLLLSTYTTSPIATLIPPKPTQTPVIIHENNLIGGSSLSLGTIVFSMVNNGYSNLYSFQPGLPGFLRISSHPWDDIHPALSPDGTKLAYSSKQNGYWNIYILELASGRVTPVTDTPEYDAHPASPEKSLQLTSELTQTQIPTSIPTDIVLEEVRPEVINLIFPTPGPLPISAWRPPLYPVPWSASEHDHFYLQRPIAADTINWPVPDYRYGGIFFGPEVVHTGVDIAAPSGSAVIAAADGKVVWAGYGLFSVDGNMQDPYGLAVEIKHDFGFQDKRLYTVYAHMRAVNVITGQQLQTGDQLGEVGETGHATGPHLHFEVRLGRNNFFDTRNPELWMAPPQGWGVLVGKITDKKGKTLTHKEIHIYALDSNKEWSVRIYGAQVVNPDDHYQENLVLSDLPAGKYRLWFNYADKDYYGKFEIYPGSITQIAFTGEKGFSVVSTKPVFIPHLTETAP